MQPTVETLISRMVQSKNKQIRNDWSDAGGDTAIDGDVSLMQDTEMRSIISTEEKMAPTTNQQQLA